jgi:hypothetical protein
MLLECKHCAATVDAKELCTHEYEDEYEEAEVSFHAKVTLAKCPVCNEPVLAYQTDMEGEGWDKPGRIYPAKNRDISWSVPKDIRRAYTEAHTCFRAKAYTAAAIMCRKTLEGICSAHGVKSSGTLTTQLEKLERWEMRQHMVSNPSSRQRTHGIPSNLFKKRRATPKTPAK